MTTYAELAQRLKHWKYMLLIYWWAIEFFFRRHRATKKELDAMESLEELGLD